MKFLLTLFAIALLLLAAPAIAQTSSGGGGAGCNASTAVGNVLVSTGQQGGCTGTPLGTSLSSSGGAINVAPGGITPAMLGATIGTMAQQNSGNVNITGGAITGLNVPVNPTDVATKSYADSIANSIRWHSPANECTAAILPNTPVYANNGGTNSTLTSATNTTLTVDGVAVALNDRVLVQNQASAFQNGIYTQTQLGTGSVPWILTRAPDNNSNANILTGDALLCLAGTANTNKGFNLNVTGTPFTIGVTNLVYVQFTGASAPIAGTGISVSGSTVSLINPVAVALGGTGIASGTSGGILGFTASGTLASSGALTLNAIVLGGGAAATPGVLASLGTTTTVLHGNAAGAPTFASVSLSADVTGSLALASIAAIANNTVVGNVSGGSLAPVALTQAQHTAMLNACTATLAGLVPTPPNNTTTFLRGDCTFAAAGGGSVSSVNTTVPGILTATNCLITTSGTCAITLTNETANLIFAGPTSGVPAAPTFRAHVTADFPANVITYAKIQQASAQTLLGNPVGSLQNVSEITLNPRLTFTGTTIDIASASITNTYLAAGAASANVGTLGGDLGSTLAAGPSVLKIHGISVPADPGGNDYTLIRTSAGATTWKQFCNGNFIGYSTASSSPTCPTQPNLSLTAGNPGIVVTPTPTTITSGAVTVAANFPVQTTKKTASYLLVDPGTCGSGSDPYSTIVFNSASVLNAVINSSTASYFPPGCAVNILNVGTGTLTVCIGSNTACLASGSSTFYGGGGTTTSFTLAQNCYAYIETDAAASPNLYMVNNSCAGAAAITGAWTKIATVVASGSPQWLQFTGLPTTYTSLHFSCAQIVNDTNAITFQLQVGEGAGPTWNTGTGYFSASSLYGNASATSQVSNGVTTIPLSGSADVNNQGANSGTSLMAEVDMDGLISGTLYVKHLAFTSSYGGVAYAGAGGTGIWGNDGGAITAVRLGVSSGGLTAGQCTAYGKAS